MPGVRVWPMLLDESDLEWCVHLGESSLFIFQKLGECHCWWTRESPRAHVAKFYGRLRLTRSVLRASKFSVLKMIEIVHLWVYYTIRFGFNSFRHFGIAFQLFKLLCLAGGR